MNSHTVAARPPGSEVQTSASIAHVHLEPNSGIAYQPSTGGQGVDCHESSSNSKVSRNSRGAKRAMILCSDQVNSQADLCIFDDFFACAPPCDDMSSPVVNVLALPDTPTSFEAKRRRLQSKMTARFNNGRPPD